LTTDQSSTVGVCYNIDTIKKRLTSTSERVDLKVSSTLTKADNEARLRSAVVPIFVWVHRSGTDRNNPIYSKFENTENAMDRFVLRDRWCFKCGGDGQAQCASCNGAGTRQNGTKMVQTSVNPRTGQPIMWELPNMVPCQNCQGGKKIKCTFCNDGRTQ